MRRSTEVALIRASHMEELLQYGISSTSYLFNQEGLMPKPQKSKLVHGLEMKITNDDERTPKDSAIQTACILDAMANIRKMKTKDIKPLAITANSSWALSRPLARGYTGWIWCLILMLRVP